MKKIWYFFILFILVTFPVTVSEASDADLSVSSKIRVDGYYSDWSSIPHTKLYFNDESKSNYGAMVIGENEIYVHYRMNNLTDYHMRVDYMELTINGTLYKLEIWPIDSNGNIVDSQIPVQGRTTGIHTDFGVFLCSVPGTSQYRNDVNGKMAWTIYDSERTTTSKGDEVEFTISLAKLEELTGIKSSEIKSIQLYNPHLGSNRMVNVGSSSGPYILVLLVWIYLLTVLKRAKLDFWHFIVGSIGMFVFCMTVVSPVLTTPLQNAVAAAAGVIGERLHLFEACMEYGTLFVSNEAGMIGMHIDYECSGMIEMGAYISLLTFFEVYSKQEKTALMIFGCIGIFCANVFRICLIGGMIHFFGSDIYFIAHTIIGRLVFYGFSILLYFYVFTKGQIQRQRIGKFGYEVTE